MHSLVLLAAGASSRMGTPKPFVRLPTGETLLDYQLTRLRAFAVTLVVSPTLDIERLTAAANVRVVTNPEPERGPFSSLQCGLGDTDTYVLPIDVPCADVFAQLRVGAAAIPTYQGRGGHPVWLSRQLVTKIKTMPPTARLDEVLREANAIRVAVNDHKVILNLNTPSDVAAAFAPTPPAST